LKKSRLNIAVSQEITLRERKSHHDRHARAFAGLSFWDRPLRFKCILYDFSNRLVEKIRAPAQ
jgi:hypothetical protein